MIQPKGAREGVSALVHIETSEQATKNETPVKQYRSFFAGFLVRFCIAVTIGVVLLVGGELFAYWRHLPNGRETMEPTVSKMVLQARGAEREYWMQLQAADKVVYHPYVLWRRAPFHASMINIDENGIRATTHSDCTDQNFTIWMFGDSTMWGAGSTDDQTIASYLAADYEQAGHKVCIVNFGEKAWANTQELIELIEQLKHARQKPNAVIFYDGGTEAFTAYQTHEADMPSNYRGFKTYLDGWNAEQQPGFSYLRKSNTHRLLNGLAAKMPFQHKTKHPEMSDAEVEALSFAVLQNYEQNMATVRLLAQQYSFRPIFAWYPTLAVGHKQLTPFEQEALAEVEEQFPGMPRVYRAAYRRCQQIHDSDLYYLGDVFDDQKGWIFLGISHVKPEGNRIVADRLFGIVQHPSESNSGDRSKPSQAAGKRLMRAKHA
jgi:hypothetical protein